MFFRITNCVKKIIIQELQAFFKDHPTFCDDLVITNKFSLDERPKYAIIVKTASADSIKLGLDNYKGMVESYVTLANLKNTPGRMIEWVREDVKNVGNLVIPGYYVVEMISDKQFTVSAFLTINDEPLDIQTGAFKHAFFKHQNINTNSELVLDEYGNRLMRDETYTMDYESGEITFIKDIDEFGDMTVDYQYIGDQTGPFDFEQETSDNVAIPGVILAFGNFLKQGGTQVVVVYPDRQEVAKAYMGKWKINLNMSAYAQDTDTQEQLVDTAAMYIWAVLQDQLVNQGIYVDNFNISGESEEDEVKTSNELAFLADISFNVEVEWLAYQPVLGVIKRIFMRRIEDFGQYENQELLVRNRRAIEYQQRAVDYMMGLQPVENLDPYLIRPIPKYSLMKTNTYVQ